ncbi:phosphoribosylanthranilate isomerase [Rhodobium orientis]|uniref:N-(5'-phosphoribosyl)anthranilate isomerase n=1 Tax=Rhodobium orientis TaxID=34017 RepID=A0A327JLJ2_9HYPH|nr:phosphoribosylanthranilate isomerase [Rhodobium orientis]MBB4302008.1 phosphoribosylanthranilate isomerase [Rhodobium orientis]MBK5950245.1 N-(5'-phosphoribosyl)anthranilate isomerase [Rhodobium orientis]RAI27157.1 phosphoribosylanthranilate isomerase [Rhodobium orientis]
MSLIIKICGLKTDGAMDAALEAGADMIGLVFFPKSPRHVAPETAARLAEKARGRAEIVALTVNPDDALLDTVMETVAPDWLQLHGTESPERVAEVRARHGRSVMKALGVSSPEDFERAGAYAGIADRLLFDAKPPKSATRPGGLGETFDWSLLDTLDPAVDFMLSGGLDAANVAEAVRRTRAIGVDVSSGVERAPGEKDADMIRAFVAATRVAADAKFAPQ